MLRPLPEQAIQLAPGVLFGGPRPLVCLPLLGVTELRPLLAEIAALPAAERPDVVEWRVDSSPQPLNAASLTATLTAAQPYALPLIVTCRLRQEGGAAEDTPERAALLVAATLLGVTIDIEWRSSQLETVLAAAGPAVPMVISWHDFASTPATLQARMAALATGLHERSAATVIKFATNVQSPDDGLAVLRTLDWLRHEWPGPLIGIGMGEYGQHTRIVAPLYGSDLTFATHPRFSPPSAPGQLTISETRLAMQLLGSGGS